MNYQEKIKYIQNKPAKKLLQIMLDKQSNIALSADLTTKKKLLKLVEQVGPFICLLKTHIDIIEDFDWDLIVKLQNLAKKYHFLILEDRKFADIGNTSLKQYTGGIYKINQWADLVTAHGLIDQGLIKALAKKNESKNTSILLLAQMSCDSGFFTLDYAKKVASLAEKSLESIGGFIAQNNQFLSNESINKFLIFTPGVSFSTKKDDLGQKYNTPKKLIQQGSDILIIGRGIYQANNPIKQTQKYQKIAWQAYLNNN